VEMTFHYRHASIGDDEMTLFWTTFDSHTLLPWVIAGLVAFVGISIAKRNAPDLKEAWDSANTAGDAS
jgi:branched-chain amino acid transport system permease protein